jgi:hypothetical protein
LIKPLSFIPETSVVTPSPSTYSRPNNYDSKEVGSNLEDSDNESYDMGDNNENIPEGNDHPAKNQPWLARDALAIPGMVA